MKRIIRPEVNFQISESELIKVFENEVFLGEINSDVYNILCTFNGQITDQERLDVLNQITTNSSGEDVFKFILNKFGYLITQASGQVTRELVPVPMKSHMIQLSHVRRIVPEINVISVTNNCFMKCIYCYAGAVYAESASPECTLSFEVIQRLVQKMRRYGTSQVTLIGGDPFLRTDIFDILDLFRGLKIPVNISTKKVFSDEEIERLVEYQDFLNLQISIDTIDSQIQQKLIGVMDYPQRALECIQKLINVGYEIKTNSVVTSHNIKTIPELLTALAEIGVQVAILSAYSYNQFRGNEVLFPAIEDYTWLNQQIAGLTEIKIEGNINFEKPEFGVRQNRICSAGVDGLVIGYDGNVSFCERMLFHEEYSLGNVYQDSILDIWNSKQLYRFYQPDVQEFIHSRCYGCKHFEYCVNTIGICYVNSIIISGRAFGPDNNCLYYEGQPRIK